MTDPITPLTAEPPRVDEALVTYTNVIYALHALAVIIGLTTAHTIIGSFIGGAPSLIAVIMNYVRRSATVGTFLESHFRWQIRTFWYALLWAVVIGVIAVPLMLVIIGIPLFILGVYALSIWIAYRVVRGWFALRERRPMYV
ncbi:MAG TPA: hypothetical protein VGI91_04255 [Steroidobacteraceae bacterium]|jgi:uncharacterized membrane protein